METEKRSHALCNKAHRTIDRQLQKGGMVLTILSCNTTLIKKRRQFTIEVVEENVYRGGEE